ncbi:hypothetical protein UPYG_G00042210 [Umbra pygmaea]|uniref:B30.2/SPRY domain-containing protein n=1 Tax=Umbra pygmaea TaxID=75934 RepID=A0ABD0XQD5_UMBPY
MEGRILPSAPTKGNWRSAFITILVIDILVISVVIGCFWKRINGFVKSSTSEKNPKKKDDTKSNEAQAETTALFKDENECSEESHKAWNEMKKYQVSINLDSTSAPPQLTVFTNKKVVYCDKDIQKCSTALHVLSEESFSNGQTYWEVDVKLKQSWYVGVVTDNAETKAGVPLIPQNGFWILSFQKGKGFYVPADPETLVTGNDDIRILGVLLDCDEQTLSFYDVQSKKQLHTFDNIGSNTFFCVFGPGSDDTIRLQVM